jgi:hypothetical protein
MDEPAINCTGANYDWIRSKRSLAGNLQAKGLVRPGPFAIEPALRGVPWESNNVNELLQPATQLAQRLSVLQPLAEVTYAG